MVVPPLQFSHRNIIFSPSCGLPVKMGMTMDWEGSLLEGKELRKEVIDEGADGGRPLEEPDCSSNRAMCATRFIIDDT